MAGIMSSFLAILSILCHTASAYFCFQCGNCPDDDNTFCEIGSDTPVCLPGSANFGKCTSQVTTTATRTWVIETATSMRYTSSVDNYETVSSLVSVAAANKVTSTETETSTVVVTKTSTVPGPTTAASQLKARDLADHMQLARDNAINSVPSTITTTITTTNSLYCINTPSQTEHCTSTVEAIWTNTLTTIVLATTTLPNQAVVTDTAIVTSTAIEMMTAAQITQNPSSTQSGASTRNVAPTSGQSNGPIPSSSAKPSSSTRTGTRIICILSIVATSLVFGVII